MNGSDTFLAYLTDERIMRAICHEVWKYVFRTRKKTPDHIRQLFLLIPPPYFWAGLETEEVLCRKHKKEIKPKEAAHDRLEHIFRRHIISHANYDHVRRFYHFADSIREIAAHPEKYSFPKPIVKALVKSESDTEVECRPISTYHDIRAKLLTGLMAKYMQSWLEPMLHETNMAYRAKRPWMGQENVAVNKTSFSIDYIMRWRAAHDGQTMYVAECDIRKFFDTIDHADLCCVFTEMHRKADKDDKAFERLFARFVDSFDFAADVMAYNTGHDDWWQAQMGYTYQPEKRYRFKWVNGITEPAGIPQGVALSPMIVNMLLNQIDEQMLGEKMQDGHITDENLLFIRYCDDMLLAHTDAAECARLIDRYHHQLNEHKLQAHPFQSVADLRTCGMPDYWNAKSKSPFLWGKGRGNASLWIGFVGYEMRYDGGIRLRKSSVASTAEKIYREAERVKHSGDEAPSKLAKFRTKSIGGCSLEGISYITDDTPYLDQRAKLEKLKARKLRSLLTRNP